MGNSFSKVLRSIIDTQFNGIIVDYATACKVPQQSFSRYLKDPDTLPRPKRLVQLCEPLPQNSKWALLNSYLRTTLPDELASVLDEDPKSDGMSEEMLLFRDYYLTTTPQKRKLIDQFLSFQLGLLDFKSSQ